MISSQLNSQPQEWHILGAGAMGCLWGFHLAKAGHRVSLVVRDKTRLEVFDRTPKLVLEKNNQRLEINLRAELVGQHTSTIKNLLVCTKSIDALSALSSLGSRIDPDSQVILLFNGMGAQQDCIAQFPDISFLCGVGNNGVYLHQPFHPVHAGTGMTYFGPLKKNALNQKEHVLQKALSGIELDWKWESNIEPQLWQKLAINCAINPLTAIHGCCNGELLVRDECLKTIREVCAEIESLMRILEFPQPSTPLYELAYQVAKATAQNYSSMHQDVKAGRQTEIDYINGYVCKVAAKLGVSTPANQALLEKVRALSPA